MALDDFVQTALDEVGYKEETGGATKFGKWYGLKNAAWCVMFASWCANEADILTTEDTGDVPLVPKMASTSALYTWYANNRRNLTPSMAANSPNRLQAGDIVVIDTKNGGAQTDHLGIVVSVDYDAGTADVVEGNRGNAVKKITYTDWWTLSAIPSPFFAATTPVTDLFYSKLTNFDSRGMMELNITHSDSKV